VLAARSEPDFMTKTCECPPYIREKKGEKRGKKKRDREREPRFFCVV